MLVAAKCTQCGANIQVDSTHEAGICPHCGTAFITEKAVNNYNTTYVTNNTYQTVTNINGGEVHIHGDSESADQLFQKIKSALENEKVAAYDKKGKLKPTIRKSLDAFRSKSSNAVQSKEIDALLALRKFSDAQKAYTIAGLEDDEEEDTEIPFFIDAEKLRNSLVELEQVDETLGKSYHAKFLKVCNAWYKKLDDRYKFKGDMLDLKFSFLYFLENLLTADFYDETYTRLFQKAKKLLRDDSQGYDGEFLLFLFDAAHIVIISEKHSVQPKAAPLIKFCSDIKNAFTPSDRARADSILKRVFFDKIRFYVEYDWKEYLSLLEKKDFRKACNKLNDLANDQKSEYAKKIKTANFKKGLFGVHYLQACPDRNLEEHVAQSSEERFRVFLKEYEKYC